MKKLILLFAAMAFSAGTFAQTDTTNRNMSHRELDRNQNQQFQYNPMDKSHPDGVVMQNGKLMMVKNGQLTALDQDLTLDNGTKIMTDGNYTKMDGTTTMLKEGEHLDESGNMTFLDTDKGKHKDKDKDRTYKDRTDKDRKDKDRNMYLVPDSTRKERF